MQISLSSFSIDKDYQQCKYHLPQDTLENDTKIYCNFSMPSSYKRSSFSLSDEIMLIKLTEGVREQSNVYTLRNKNS